MGCEGGRGWDVREGRRRGREGMGCEGGTEEREGGRGGREGGEGRRRGR